MLRESWRWIELVWAIEPALGLIPTQPWMKVKDQRAPMIPRMYHQQQATIWQPI